MLYFRTDRISGSDFHEVASTDVEAAASANDLERLGAAQPCDFRGAGSGCKARIEAIDINAQIDGTLAELDPDLLHQGYERSVPALLGLYDVKPLIAAPIEIFGRVYVGKMIWTTAVFC
jgi:hypothetical protein